MEQIKSTNNICICPNSFNELVDKLIKKVDLTKYKYVMGVPRGGCMVSQAIALKTNLKDIDSFEYQLYNASPEEVLFVDDIIDSGKTKSEYVGDFEALINKQIDKEFKGQWIEFWYEKTEQDDKDLVLRIAQRLGVDVK